MSRPLGRLVLLAALLLPSASRAAEDPLPEGALARVGSGRLRHVGSAISVAFAADGKALASGGKDGLVRLWETATGREIRRFQGHKGNVDGLAFSPDGKTLLSAGTDNTVCLWDLATGNLRLNLILVTRTASANAVAFAPDGKAFVAAGKNGAARIWDLDGKLLHVFRGAINDRWPSLAFAPDGKILALVNSARELLLMDLTTGKELRRWVCQKQYVTSLDFSRDGTLLASAGGAVRIWDVATGKELRQLGVGEEGIGVVRFSPDQKTLATCDNGKAVRLWDVETGKELRRYSGHTATVSAVAFSPDGKVLASTGGDEAVKLWDVATGKELPQSVESLAVACAVLSGDGKLLVTGHQDGHLRFWEPATGKRLARTLDVDGPVTAVALSRDGKAVAAGTRARGLCAWDADTGKIRFVVPSQKVAERDAEIIGLAFSPDGRGLMVLGAPDRREMPAFYDAVTGRPKLSPLAEGHALLGTGLGPSALDFSADGTRIVTASFPYGVRMFGAGIDKPEGIVLNPRAGERSAGVAFAADGRSLATSVWGALPGTGIGETDYSAAVQLWETATGKQRRSWDVERVAADAVAVSADGRLVAAPGAGGGVRVWHAPTGRELRTLKGHDGRVTALAFAADGKLLSVGADGTAVIWGTSALKPAAKERPRLIDAEAAWVSLADDDAAKAYETMTRLGESPAAAVGLLRERLRPADIEEAKHIDRLIAQLDDDDFDRRDEASRGLARLGVRALGPLRKAARAPASEEVARRAADLLKRIEGDTVSGERLREMRALEVLEGLGTLEARKLLEELARGAADAVLTQEAKASLQRLGK
jgi:WD40 repeat protein